MDNNRTLLNKTLVLGIGILFVCMSVVSSTRTIDTDIFSKTQILDAVDSSEEKLFRGKYGYAYNAYPGPEGTVYFPLDDPEDINECGDTISGNFLTGGTIDCDGIWYACEYDSGILYSIDTNNNCEMSSIGAGVGNDLAWDDETYYLYYINDNHYLYWYDPETGEGGYIGYIEVSLSQIEFDNSGILYGFDFSGPYKMYTIDLSTLEATFVGTISNITSTWSLGVAFDKDTNNLYLLGENGLYICDTETYDCTLIGYTGGIELTSFVIPYGDDTSPPVTACTFDPPEPDGLNGWYVSNVTVELTATDNISGVKELRISICGNPEIIIPGNYLNLFFNEDYKDYFVDYWAIDNAGNVEPKKRFYINIDRTAPDVSLYFIIEQKHFWDKLKFIFTANARDSTSGMDSVEFYMDDVYKETVFAPGPYEWIWKPYIYGHVVGFILKPEITEEYVKFFTLFVRAEFNPNKTTFYAYGFDKAGNMDMSYLNPFPPPYTIYDHLFFYNLTLPNNYEGYIGRFYINAKFNYN
jgi:hypothetical protein